MHVSSDPKFWDSIGEKFYKKYSGIDKCHHRWAETVMKGEPLQGPFGREWSIPNRDKKGELFVPWTTLTNYPVQGTGADIMTLARVAFAKRLKATGWPVLLVLTVHDSIVVDAPAEYLDRVAELMMDVFNNIPKDIERLFGVHWNLPMPCEVKYGPNLKDMQKYIK